MLNTIKYFFLSMGLFVSIGVLAQKRSNVLFIAVDDLNNWVGCLEGHPQTKTPNIDKLASEGVLFTNAHCQAPICGSSRASVMTGLYPFTSGNYLQLNDVNIKKSNKITEKVIFMPDYFEQHGYKTMGVGKIYHYGDKANTFDEYGGLFEWFGPKPAKRLNYNPQELGKQGNTQTDWGPFPELDSQMPDYKSASWAINRIKKEHGQPFFLAVGFMRPHVPWHVPQKWFDKFPIDEIKTPSYLKTDLDDIPEMGLRMADVPMMPTTEWLIETNQWKDVVQAYLACVNFVDAQIGRVFQALEESPNRDNTIVVLWSDHGYHLGFAKMSLWRQDTRTVLVFRTPGGTKNIKCKQPVQLIDIYPTLVELCGLHQNTINEGNSLVPLLNNPLENDWPHVAISAYGKNNIAISDKRYRLIQYEDKSIEFYDLKKDANEWRNVFNKRKYQDEIKRLKSYVPTVQSNLSPFSSYNINEYFKNLTLDK